MSGAHDAAFGIALSIDVLQGTPSAAVLIILVGVSLAVGAAAVAVSLYGTEGWAEALGFHDREDTT